MKRTKKFHKKSSTLVEQIGVWVIALAVLTGLANYAYKQVPYSSAATPVKIAFTAPQYDTDWDMGAMSTVTFTWPTQAFGGQGMTIDFYVEDYFAHKTRIKTVAIPAGARSGSFSWRVGYDSAGRRISWLPENDMLMTAMVVGGGASRTKPFNIMPADLGNGQPIIYYVHPNRGWSDGGYKTDIHGRNLVDGKKITNVLFDESPATILPVSTGSSGRKLVVLTPPREHEPLLVNITLINEKGIFTLADAYQYVTKI